MSVQRTLVIFKPDAHARLLVGKIRERILMKDFRILNEKVQTNPDQLAEHYKEHYGKEYYAKLMEFMQSGTLTTLIVEGVGAIAQMRLLAGATDPLKRDMGSIRGMWSNDMMLNLIHTSDGEEAAKREITLWYGESALI